MKPDERWADGSRVRRMTPNATDIAKILRSFDARVLDRGRNYAARGLVGAIVNRSTRISATVKGTHVYEVVLRQPEGGPLSTDCTCQAQQQYGECKHVAALLLVLQTKIDNAGIPAEEWILPPVFREVHSVDDFFDSLAVYEKGAIPFEPLHVRRSLADWWWTSVERRKDVAIRKVVLRQQDEVGKVLAQLRDFEPGPSPAPGSVYAAHHAHLAAEYRACRRKVRVLTAVPGPFDERHPGFDLTFDRKKRLLQAIPRKSPWPPPLPRYGGPPVEPVFSVTLPGEAGVTPRFHDRSFHDSNEVDAWQLFALREVLLALEKHEDPVCEALFAELSRPVWEHALRVLVKPPRVLERHEWLFVINLGGDLRRPVDLFVFCRRLHPTGASKANTWKRSSLEALLVADAARSPEEPLTNDDRELQALECAIARAGSGRDSGGRRGDASFVLTSGHGYELARLLARHPRCLRSGSYEADPETAVPVRILAGALTMRLEPTTGPGQRDEHDDRSERADGSESEENEGDRNQRNDGPEGHFVPRFFVEGERLPRLPGLFLQSADGPISLFRAATIKPGTIVCVEISPQLRPWVDTARIMGEELAFPAEAVTALEEATRPLVTSGLVELPAQFLGEEGAYAPHAGLRVEWQTNRGLPVAYLELMVEVAPRAPLVMPGEGARLFTFEDRGRRLYVERQRHVELPLALEAARAIEAPIVWSGTRGQTKGVEDTLALASYLERNPLALPIDVKEGRPPVVREYRRKDGTLVTKRVEEWLSFDGALEVPDGVLTVGAILDAARLANRYVRASNNVFVELSAEVLAKLRPLALAAALAPRALPPSTRASGGSRSTPPSTTGGAAVPASTAGHLLHPGFGKLLGDAAQLFDVVQEEGLDLSDFVRRFEESEREVELPPLENGTLRPYQRDGIGWMLRLASWAPGCVLADDMGLGKTIQTAVVLKARAKLGPALVIAPASVASNWVAELGRFMPSLEVRWFNADRADPPSVTGPGQVLVVSYGLLQRQNDLFTAHHWATVVVDEAQYVKTLSARRSHVVRSLSRSFTIALTGTPLENHLGELFSIFEVAFPRLLGNERVFRSQFRRPIERAANTDALGSLSLLLAPFLLRRTRAAVLEELPPREEITEYLDLSPEEADRYVALRTAVERELSEWRARKKGDPGKTPAQLRLIILAALMRLRQLACEVRLLDEAYTGPSTKISRAVDLATQIASADNRCLVFSVFTTFLEKVRDAFVRAGLRVAYLTGETPVTERPAIIEGFQAGKYDVFCISLLAGGTGLNLTRASYVIHLDPWWNPAVEEQATARAHRMGQTEPVTVYRLVSRGTIEEAVLDIHQRKRDLAAAVLEGKESARTITPEELLELVRFGS